MDEWEAAPSIPLPSRLALSTEGEMDLSDAWRGVAQRQVKPNQTLWQEARPSSTACLPGHGQPTN